MSGPAATVAIGAILLGAALFAYVRSTHGAPARQRLVRVRVKQTGATLTVSPADGIVRVAGAAVQSPLPGSNRDRRAINLHV